MKNKEFEPRIQIIKEGTEVNGHFEGVDHYTDKKERREALLLHSCCGPCSTSVIERLVSRYDVTVFFYNPNIYDDEEYERRLESQIRFIKSFNQSRKALETEKGALTFNRVELLLGEYRPEEFYGVAKGLENEPEGGQRCVECFRLRLEKTAQLAEMGGFPIFATTLTVSPHKNYAIITDIGRYLGAKHSIEYLDEDFKKSNGYLRSIELSKEYNLYRQRYCGCVYSQEKKEEKG